MHIGDVVGVATSEAQLNSGVATSLQMQHMAQLTEGGAISRQTQHGPQPESSVIHPAMSYDSIIDFLGETMPRSSKLDEVDEQQWALYKDVGGLIEGAEAVSIPEAKVVDGRIFPMTLRPQNRGQATAAPGQRQLLALVAAERGKIFQLVRTHGAVLLRGWGAASADDFAALNSALYGVEHFDMACSAGPRTEVAHRVFTANEAPPSERIPFHHEMAQCDSPPEHIAFFCEQAPAQGGATPIIQSHLVATYLRRTHPAFAAKLKRLGVRYVRVMPEQTDPSSALGKSWRISLGVENQEQAEEKLRASATEFEWLPGNFLRTVSPIGPALVDDDISGREMFFTAAETTLNHAPSGMGHDGVQRPVKAIIFGDDSQLRPGEFDALADVGQFMLRTQVRVCPQFSFSLWRCGKGTLGTE
jgi:hypothetical protein